MRFLTKKIDEMKSDTIVCFMFEDEKNNSELFQYLNELSRNQLEKQIYEYKLITGKYQEMYKYAINNELKVIVYGLGKKDDLTRPKFSQAIANLARTIKNSSKKKTIAFELIKNNENCSCNKFTKAECAQMLLTSARIGMYEFTKYLSKKQDQIEIIELIDNDVDADIEKGATIGAYTSFAMKFTKDLVNESAQIVTPRYISNLATIIAKEHKLESRIFGKSAIRELGMHAFLAVSQGSIQEPRFIHLIYKPKTTPRKRIALIGKGITFDAGGLNLKQAPSMLTMKSDMTGAASVLGIVQAISRLKADIELHIICALCENMPSGMAYKQGDVVKAMNGKTIEIDNTDAEGRLTLADALCYTDLLDVDEVIDIATLTGAVSVALGNNITGIMGNNQKQIDNFKTFAELSGERVWQMPIFDEMKYNLKSEIADFKNTGGRNAGTSTAAWFLSNFTKSKAWLHLDIAGTAYLDKSNRETLSGPTGVMIRTLINYLIS